MADGTDNSTQPTSPTPTPAVMASASAPANVQTTDPDAPGQVTDQSSSAPQGFLGKTWQGIKNIPHDIVEAGGHGTPQYSVDDTGKLTELATNATPGTLFKNLLVGALTGLGASASTRGRGGMGAAAGVGFTAAMGAAQEQDDRARAQAIQAAEVKQKQQSMDLQKQDMNLRQKTFDANAAHWNVENLRAQHIADLQDDEWNQRQNQYNEEMLEKSQEAGGTPIQVKGPDGKDINGERGNSTALMQWYSQPGNAKSPTGGTLKLITTKDLDAMKADGVHFDVDKGFYVDSAGKRTNIDKYTANTIMDTPPNYDAQLVNVSKKQMAELGIDTSADQTQMSMGKYTALSQRAQETRMQQANMELSKQMMLLQGIDGNLARLSDTRDKILSDPNNAFEISKDPSKAADLTKTIDAEYAKQVQMRDKIMKRFGLAPDADAAATQQQQAATQLPAPMAGFATVLANGNGAPMQIPLKQLDAYKAKYKDAPVRMPDVQSPTPAAAPQSMIGADVSALGSAMKGPAERVAGAMSSIE